MAIRTRTGAERYNNRMNRIFDNAKALKAKREAELKVKFPLLEPCCAGMLSNMEFSEGDDMTATCATCGRALEYTVMTGWHYDRQQKEQQIMTTTANEIIQDGKVRTLAQRANGETYIESERRLTAEERNAAGDTCKCTHHPETSGQCVACRKQITAQTPRFVASSPQPSEPSDSAAATARPNTVTLTNRIALVLTQSAHANLSHTTAALLAQRIVESCLPDYVQAVNSFDAMRDALRAVLPTCSFIVNRDNGTECGELAPWSGSFGLRYCEEHQERRIQNGRIKRGEGYFHEDVARGIAALALAEGKDGR